MTEKKKKAPKERKKPEIKKRTTGAKTSTENFTFIDTAEELRNACKHLAEQKSFAIDLECENGLHHYGTYICLVQISTETEHIIIDTLKFPDRKSFLPLLKILEDPKIEKILHDYSFDLRILYTQYKSRPQNVFDTQMACLLLGKEKLGLASLLEEYCQITAEKKFQRYDWTKRPLPQKMLDYAIGDTKNLLFIKKKLVQELREKKRMAWCNQECKEIEHKKLEYQEQSFYDVKGIRSLDNKQRAILLKLWQLRDEIAKKHDKPLHYILGTKLMMEMAQNPPKNQGTFKRLPRSNRFLIANSKRFLDAIESAKGFEIMVPPKERKRMTKEQKEEYAKIEEKRNKVAEKLNIRSYLIASNDQLLEITLSNKMNCLRVWQKKLLE